MKHEGSEALHSWSRIEPSMVCLAYDPDVHAQARRRTRHGSYRAQRDCYQIHKRFKKATKNRFHSNHDRFIKYDVYRSSKRNIGWTEDTLMSWHMRITDTFPRVRSALDTSTCGHSDNIPLETTRLARISAVTTDRLSRSFAQHTKLQSPEAKQ